MYRPSKGPITQAFGNIQPDGNPHTGYDFGYTDGVRTYPDVYAAAEGVVLYVGDSRALGWPNPWYFNPDFDRSDAWDSSAGNVIVLGHDDGVTTYSHLQSWNVRKGQTVPMGHRIAEKGNTGNSYGKHLHFEWIPYPFNFGTRTFGRQRPTFETKLPATAKGPLMALSDKEQKELLDKVRAIYINTSDIRRDGKMTPLNQEVADIKTMLLKDTK